MKYPEYPQDDRVIPLKKFYPFLDLRSWDIPG